jgi:sodium/proline symporter
MIAAVLSAMMSTADSQLLVASSTVVHDAGLGGRTRRTMLRRSRLTVILLTAAAAVAANLISESIFKNVLFAWTAMGAAFGPLLLVRLVMRRKLAIQRVFAAMLTGFVLSVAAHLWYVEVFGTKDGKNFANYVVPWIGAFLVAFLGTKRAEREPEGSS